MPPSTPFSNIEHSPQAQAILNGQLSRFCSVSQFAFYLPNLILCQLLGARGMWRDWISGDVTPSTHVSYVIDRILRHVENSTNFQGTQTIPEKFYDPKNFCGAQNGMASVLAPGIDLAFVAYISTFYRHVHHIIGLGSLEKMLLIATGRVVTFVANVQISRISMNYGVSYTMRQVNDFMMVDNSIARIGSSGCPWPALIGG